MGIFSDILPDDWTPNSPAPAAAPPQPAPNAIPAQPDFVNNLVAAAKAQGQANPGSLWNWLTGRQTEADIAKAKAMAPQLYQQLLAQQSQTRNAQLGTAQGIAGTGAMTGTNINPDNISASIPAITQAYRQVFGGGLPGVTAPSGGPTIAPQNAPAPAQPAIQPAQMTLGLRNNNPGNLMPGGKMATFPSMSAGIQAASSNLDAYAKQGINTVAGIVSKWAPQYNDQGQQINDTPAYIAHVSQMLNVQPNQPLNLADPNVHRAVLGALFTHENGPVAGSLLSQQAAGPQSQPASQQPDQNAAVRAMYMRMAQLRMMMGDPTGSKNYFDMANLGRPDGTVPTTQGAFAEPTVQTPTGPMPAQAYAARGENMNAAAKTAGTNTQTPVQVIGRNGPMTISVADQLANRNQIGADGKPNWLPEGSKQYQAIQSQQQADITAWRQDATQATTGLDTAMQLYNAANGLITGKGAETLQGVRKMLVSIGNMTGTPVPANIINSTSQFEMLKYATLNFVQAAAHSFSPRAAVQVVRMIQAAKPGEMTSPVGLKNILEKEVIPTFLRMRGMYAGTVDYYQKHPLDIDAEAHVPDEMPISQFTVKHFPENVNPGDYYVSRNGGVLKQLPGQ
jgi:hypothetical protein